MSLLTLFTSPKPLDDPRIATIQLNALRSWAKLPDVEILVMGDGEGIAEAAGEVGAQHIGDVRTNELGVPLVSSMIEMARTNSSSGFLCIINSDMVAMPDLVEAAQAAAAARASFVMLGRRWDVSLNESLDYSMGWERRLRDLVRVTGTLHRTTGSDFFVFPRHCYTDVPDFAVGRGGWDNWMIFEARREGWAVIDCTPSVMIVHQTHDYGHLPGGLPHHTAPETERNIQLAGGEPSTRYTILDATHVLSAGRLLRPPLSSERFLRGLEVLLRRILFFLPPRWIEELARPRRWRRRLRRLLGRASAVRSIEADERKRDGGVERHA